MMCKIMVEIVFIDFLAFELAVAFWTTISENDPHTYGQLKEWTCVDQGNNTLSKKGGRGGHIGREDESVHHQNAVYLPYCCASSCLLYLQW